MPKRETLARRQEDLRKNMPQEMTLKEKVEGKKCGGRRKGQ